MAAVSPRTDLHPSPEKGSGVDSQECPAASLLLAKSDIFDRRPKSSSGIHNLSVNVNKASRYEADSNTPYTAIPSLGGSGATGPSVTPVIIAPAEPSTVSSPKTAFLTSLTAPSPDSNQQQPRDQYQPTAAHDLLPRQTILKALASTTSVSRPRKPEALSFNNMLFPQSNGGSSAAASPQQLVDALQDLAKKRNTPTSAISNLLSPCFYHQRFDDAVDFEKVLDEIKNDESMSHSRLVQTATSVREISKQLQRRPVKRAVRNVMIVTKARDNQLVYLTRELTTWLLQTPRYGSDVGVNVYVDAKLRNSKRFDAAGIVAQDARFETMLKYWTPDLCWSQPEKFDLVLTLGGDGTVLFTSWLFQRIVPPVLSFSLGSLGFMTTFEFENYKKHLNRVMGDDGMKINLRMRFTCTVWREGSNGNPDEGEQFEVLNELVIDRGPSPYVSNLELYGDDELLTVVQADGCIFSTPTGSTAYSLSAGGSLVHPDIPAILLTPICPHTLSFRPMVLSDTMALRVAVPRNSRATAYCAFDGKGRVELKQGDHVTITASQYPFPTVTRTDTEWFDSVSRTLRWNVRAAAQKPFDASGISPDGDDDNDDSWDIDTDSAYYASEEGSTAASPVRRQMSMLGM
ncbi:NAD kinase associated with ferric reductase [Trichoderma pleuroticola]|uniref:NAD+ kinase n=1 Tax=Trichoderma harzianum TaxID=5544 RepID=A0A2K0TX73_TRIHA|nr:hypothetical protein THARTR1_09127 [Trichoderma harzianum]